MDHDSFGLRLRGRCHCMSLRWPVPQLVDTYGPEGDEH